MSLRSLVQYSVHWLLLIFARYHELEENTPWSLERYLRVSWERIISHLRDVRLTCIIVVFFFAYTSVRNDDQNIAFSCVVSFAINIYYGTLYAYSPEVLPSGHRATGNGTAVALNRVMGIMSAIVATYADTSTPVPVYICAALFAVMAAISAIFPYEPQDGQSI